MRRRRWIPARAGLPPVMAILVASPLFAQSSRDSCRALDAGIALDHVVIAAQDLASAAADFRSLGFTLKPGRLHSNGLLNAHVKFADGTALELMSVERASTDPLATLYESFLLAGDGGVFVAIEADPARVTEAAGEMGLSSEVTRSGSFTWVTVDDSRRSPGGWSSPVFFISYGPRTADPDSILVHNAGATGIGAVTLDATGDLANLLFRLGARACPIDTESEMKSSVIVGLRNAELVLSIHEGPPYRRAVVRQVALYGASGTPKTQPRLLDEQRTHGIRLMLDAGQ
jgi:hypothetical protein